MDDKILMGFDFGTNGVKAVAYSVKQEKVVMSAYKSYPVVTPYKNQAEHIPKEWWNAFVWCIGKLLAENTFQKDQVSALCVSSHTPTLTPIGEDGEPLMNGMIWADGRAVSESLELRRDYGEEIALVNPAFIRPYHIISKLFWLKKHKKDIYDRAVMFLDCSNYITYRLTSRFTIDRSMATNYHFYNIFEKKWDSGLAEKLQIDLDCFPEVCDCNEVIGCITEEAAQELGLPKHILVAAGASDTAMAALSAGIFNTNQMAYSCGTGSSVVMLRECTERETYKTDDRLITIGYADKDYMMNIGVMSNTGGAFKWMKEAVCDMETLCAVTLHKDVFTVMSDYVTEAPIGANGIVFLPYLAGELSPIYNPNARGVFFGLSGTSTKKEMLRAVMEGTCYAVRQNVDIVLDAQEMKPDAVEGIVATGGPCKSSAWMQMLSDILGIPVTIQENTEGAAIGDVVVAGCAAGIFSNLKEGAGKMKTIGRTYLPDPENQRQYEINYKTYCELQKCLLPCFDSHMLRQKSRGTYQLEEETYEDCVHR